MERADLRRRLLDLCVIVMVGLALVDIATMTLIYLDSRKEVGSPQAILR